MIKLSEIESKYGDYLVDENKLKELLVKPEPKTVWDLKDDDKYCYITALGDINYITWVGDGLDLKTREIGNAVLTIKEAEFELERRRCEAIMLKYGRRIFKHQEQNWFLYFSYMENQIKLGCNFEVSHQGLIYFDSEELAKKAVESLTEYRLKKYVLGVEPKKED